MLDRRHLASLCAGLLLSLPAAHAGTASGPLDVLRATLNNGLRVVVVRNTLAPVVTTEMNYLVGSNEAPAGFPGTAHALEHMMFRGSPGLSKDQLAEIAAAMGGDFNADTTQTVTQYFFTVPAEDLGVALQIDALRMQGLDASQAEWTNERGAIEQEVSRDLSDPQYVFYSQLLATLFEGTPYAYDALGTRPSFDKTSAGMLKDFYSSWYAPNNAILVIVGDVDPQATLTEVQTLYGSISAKPLPARPAVHLQPVKAKTLELPTDLPYGLVLLSYRLPSLTDRDYAASQVLGDVLASRRGDLYALVPAGKALYTGFEANGLPQAGLGFAIGVFPKGGDSSALVKDMRAVLAGFLKDGASKELVDAAKRQEIAQLELQKNSVSGLANVWSEALAFQGLNSPEDMADAFRAVSVADVDRAARSYLDEQHMVTAVLTPQSSGKPISGKGFGGAESLSSTPEKPVALPDWAVRALARLDIPKSTVNPHVSTLANGIKLIVQPEDVSDTVSVYGRIANRAPMQEAKGKDGVSQVLDGLFEYGSTSLDRLAFQKALDDIAADEKAGVEFSVRAPAQDFERAVQLLADNELHPALPPTAFPVVQSQTARFLAGNLGSPDYLFQRAYTKALVPEGDPSLREATPESVMGLKLDDVRDYYAQAFRPDLASIVVIGKITPEEARRVVEKYFGNWAAKGPLPRTDLPAIPVNKPSQAVVPDQSSVQDQVVLIQSLGSDLFNPQRYALEVGNQVLGGGFYASRLSRDLREKAGLVYSVNSRFQWGRTRAFYEVTYGCDPDKVSEARALVMNDLASMQGAPISDSELAQAQATLLRRIPLHAASVDGVALNLLKHSIDGLPLDEDMVAAQHYAKITAAEVQAAFKQWLRQPDMVQVVKGPAPK
ncbi:MAG TPA: pitrilysin family protein [Gammaproteobacteria bacterium]|nr:pitrilysin family protein [Gammaproteobacteria bacterium]